MYALSVVRVKSAAARGPNSSATSAKSRTLKVIVTAERKFWRCVESGEPPRLFWRLTSAFVVKQNTHPRFYLQQ
jgi:hypothetical protein